MQVKASESGTTNRLDTMEHHLQLISAQLGLDAVSSWGNNPQPDMLQKSVDQASGAQQGSAVTAPMVQQLKDMRAELTHLQQAQVSAQPHTAPVASIELAGLRHQLEEQSSQVQQLHRLVADWKQDSAVLQASSAAQGRAVAQVQQGHQDLSLQVNTVSADIGRQCKDQRGAISVLEERQGVAHAQLRQELSKFCTDLGKLSSSSLLLDEQLQQHSAMLAQHEQQLASNERLKAEAPLAFQKPQEKAGSATTNSLATGVI